MAGGQEPSGAPRHLCQDAFGRHAENAARLFGTPQYIAGQTIVVIVWIALNAVGIALAWDPYPFILLNLAFSLQAAYAAPLILLAQTWQAERDKIADDRAEDHHERLEKLATKREQEIQAGTERLVQLLNSNTTLTKQDKDLTEQVAALTREIHAQLVKKS
ncbi:MAG: DUF1003 domain-containing protein [Gaiellaceae bacterium]